MLGNMNGLCECSFGWRTVKKTSGKQTDWHWRVNWQRVRYFLIFKFQVSRVKKKKKKIQNIKLKKERKKYI
jgi:hypothetical protein